MTAPVRFAFPRNFLPPSSGPDSQSEDQEQRERRDLDAVAYARGFEDGQASEQVAAARRLAEAAETIAERLAEASSLISTQLDTLEAEAAELALSFAQNLTLGLVPAAAQVEETFRRALRDLNGTLALSVTLNPAVLPQVDARLGELAAGVNPALRVRLISDRSMPAGDCIIRWAQGEIAASKSQREQRLLGHIAQLCAPAHNAT